MAATVFYSWQSDSDKSLNRNFIEDALGKAIKQMNRDTTLIPALRGDDLALDKDTQGVPGSPPIVDTILEKISNSAVFVPDLTFVGKSTQGRLLPNPNVLIEYGWALKALGHRRILPVMNAASGEPTSETMPFDMRHLRHPITYHLSADDDAETKSQKKAELVQKLATAISVILANLPAENDVSPKFNGQAATFSPSTFWQKDEKFSAEGRFHATHLELSIPDVPRMFLRVIPQRPIANIDTSKATLDLIRSTAVRPLGGHDMGGWFHERNRYGAFACNADDGVVRNLTQLFRTGELWGVDCWTLDPEIRRRFLKIEFGFFPCDLFEEIFVQTLVSYLKFYREKLKIKPPLRIIAGATNVAGFRMSAPHGMNFGFAQFGGKVIETNIIKELQVDDIDTPPQTILLPFFQYVWEECGLTRPDKEHLG